MGMMQFLAILFIVVHCNCKLIDSSTVSNVSNATYKATLTKKVPIKITLQEIEKNVPQLGMNVVKTRFKRQQSSGAGKFTEAATMPQIKALRLFLTMFKNIWASAYIGGAHPFHHNVPKPVVQLFKQRIVEFFFPDVGEEKVK